jgi:hypothetical protein
LKSLKRPEEAVISKNARITEEVVVGKGERITWRLYGTRSANLKIEVERISSLPRKRDKSAPSTFGARDTLVITEPRK